MIITAMNASGCVSVLETWVYFTDFLKSRWGSHEFCAILIVSIKHDLIIYFVVVLSKIIFVSYVKFRIMSSKYHIAGNFGECEWPRFCVLANLFWQMLEDLPNSPKF